MKKMDNESIDMVFTSPPYADRRKSTYGGTVAIDYVDWFLPIATEIKRILKKTGSFFLNIKPHTEMGERVLYVFDLVLALKRSVGFKFVDEFAWTKNPYPGKFNGRFKNGFEPIYHFSKGECGKITFNPVACGTKLQDQSVKRISGKQCVSPVNGSGMGGVSLKRLGAIECVRPSNVIVAHNVNSQGDERSLHPAVFPVKLVEFFVKSFTNESMGVLDPFMGSGTTGIICRNLNRNFTGIEIDPNYFKLAENIIKNDLFANYPYSSTSSE